MPFTGAAPAMAAVVAGHTLVGFSAPTAAVPLYRDGKLRALAVTSKSRIATLPEIATLAEGGYPEIEGDSFVGFVVPAGTPPDIVALPNREIVRSMSTADMKERQEMLGNDPVGSTRIRQAHQDGARHLGQVIRAAGIKAG